MLTSWLVAALCPLFSLFLMPSLSSLVKKYVDLCWIAFLAVLYTKVVSDVVYVLCVQFVLQDHNYGAPPPPTPPLSPTPPSLRPPTTSQQQHAPPPLTAQDLCGMAALATVADQVRYDVCVFFTAFNDLVKKYFKNHLITNFKFIFKIISATKCDSTNLTQFMPH